MTEGSRTRLAGRTARILIADPDEAFSGLLEGFLTSLGYDVVRVSAFDELRTALKSPSADLLVLEVDFDGHDSRTLLADTSLARIPTMLLTSRGLDADVIAGLDMGADGYVVKPVSPEVLAARIRALLRRSILHNFEDAPALAFDGITIDQSKHLVLVADAPVDLTPKEFSLLSFLARDPRQTFTREQILEHVWDDARPRHSLSTVTEHVSRVRTKIEKDPNHPRWLVTVPGSGYRFERRATPR